MDKTSNKSELEKILLEAAATEKDIKKMVLKNTEDTLRSVVQKEEISNFFKQAISEAEDTDMEDVDADSTDVDDTELDYTETDVDGMDDATADDEESDDFESDETDEMSDDFEDSEDSEDFESDDYEESNDDFESDDMGDTPIDLNAGMDADSDVVVGMQQLYDKITSMGLKDGESITITSKPAFSVQSSGGDMDMPMGEGKKVKKGKKIDEIEGCKDESMTEGELNEVEFTNTKKANPQSTTKNTAAKTSKFNNAPKTKTNSLDKNDTRPALKSMQEQLRKMVAINDKLMTENKKLKDNNEKAAKAIQESTQNIKKIALHNTNLGYAMRLFVEGSTSQKEKSTILEAFDNSKSIEQSKSLFNQFIKKMNKQQQQKPPINKKEINEIKENQTKTEETKPKTLIKEGKVQSDLDRVTQLFSYKNNTF